MNCKDCRKHLPDLLLDPASTSAVRVHMQACPACHQEFTSLQATFNLLDEWTAPEPSRYFDQKLAVLLRAEQQTAPAGFLERLRSRLLFNTGRDFRPAYVAALALFLVVGAGTVIDFSSTQAHHIQTSATVNDLQILDKNDQALQTMDQLLQEDNPGDNSPNGSSSGSPSGDPS